MTVYIGEGDQLSADSSAAGLLVLAGIHALLNAVPTSRLGGLSALAATITNAVADVDGERALLDLMCSAPRLLVEILQRHRLSAVKHGTCALRAGVDTLCMRPVCAANPRGVEAIALLDLGPGEGVCRRAEC